MQKTKGIKITTIPMADVLAAKEAMKQHKALKNLPGNLNMFEEFRKIEEGRSNLSSAQRAVIKAMLEEYKEKHKDDIKISDSAIEKVMEQAQQKI
jgi:hypothetical protein